MRTLRALVCAATAVGWLAAAGTSTALPFDIDCGGATNIDTNPATVVTCNVATTGTITDLDVVINIDDLVGNPYATDLQITLVHVATSTSVAVFVGSEVANPQSVMDATFDDAAASAPPGSGDIIGTFLPDEALSAFNGLELSGDWDFVVLDASPYPNEGIDLIEWRLTGTQVPEPSTAVLLSLGLCGLAAMSRRQRASTRAGEPPVTGT